MKPYEDTTDLTPEGLAQQADHKLVNEHLRKLWKKQDEYDKENKLRDASKH